MSGSDSCCGKFSYWLLALMRIAIGLLFMQHGGQKLLNYPPGNGTVHLLSLPGLSGVLELVGGGFVLVGLFTRPIAFILSGEMAFAYFMVHAKRGLWPIQNGGELPVVYCFVFLYLSAAGAGPLSLDSIFRAPKKPAA
jgi:putative oxidoreductase